MAHLAIEVPPKPICYLEWSDGTNHGVAFTLYNDFNWFQKKMLKWCFGLEYRKFDEV